jgi:hypothetical protein
MKAFLLNIFILISSNLHSQTLIDLYKMLPQSSVLTDEKTTEKMIINYRSGQQSYNIPYAFDIIDEKNGFLNITGGFEGNWEMCYWNIGSKKLVAVYYQACGPACYIERFEFFSFENGQLQNLRVEDVIPGYTTLYDEFFNGSPDSLKKELEKKDVGSALLFQLPRKGKDLLAIFGSEAEASEYKPYLKGDRRVLKFENGKFVKDKFYWQN